MSCLPRRIDRLPIPYYQGYATLHHGWDEEHYFDGIGFSTIVDSSNKGHSYHSMVVWLTSWGACTSKPSRRYPLHSVAWSVQGAILRFVNEYLVDPNATQAAVWAGCSEQMERQIGEENLSKPDITEAVAATFTDLEERTGVSRERVIESCAVSPSVRWTSILNRGLGAPLSYPATSWARTPSPPWRR